jgi:chaperonin cofactor prefoldin
MPRKEFDINQQKQLLRVQLSELEHLPADRQVFRSMGSVLMPSSREELLDDILDKEQMTSLVKK